MEWLKAISVSRKMLNERIHNIYDVDMDGARPEARDSLLSRYCLYCVVN